MLALQDTGFPLHITSVFLYVPLTSLLSRATTKRKRGEPLNSWVTIASSLVEFGIHCKGTLERSPHSVDHITRKDFHNALETMSELPGLDEEDAECIHTMIENFLLSALGFDDYEVNSVFIEPRFTHDVVLNASHRAVTTDVARAIYMHLHKVQRTGRNSVLASVEDTFCFPISTENLNAAHRKFEDPNAVPSDEDVSQLLPLMQCPTCDACQRQIAMLEPQAAWDPNARFIDSILPPCGQCMGKCLELLKDNVNTLMMRHTWQRVFPAAYNQVEIQEGTVRTGRRAELRMRGSQVSGILTKLLPEGFEDNAKLFNSLINEVIQNAQAEAAEKRKQSQEEADKDSNAMKMFTSPRAGRPMNLLSEKVASAVSKYMATATPRTSQDCIVKGSLPTPSAAVVQLQSQEGDRSNLGAVWQGLKTQKQGIVGMPEMSESESEAESVPERSRRGPFPVPVSSGRGGSDSPEPPKVHSEKKRLTGDISDVEGSSYYSDSSVDSAPATTVLTVHNEPPKFNPMIPPLNLSVPLALQQEDLLEDEDEDQVRYLQGLVTA